MKTFLKLHSKTRLQHSPKQLKYYLIYPDDVHGMRSVAMTLTAKNF